MNQIIGAHSRPLVVASQLGAKLDGEISKRVPQLSIIDVPVGSFEAAPEAEVWFAAPHRFAGVPERPLNWPGQIRWIQLVSVGIDSYPDWLFDVPTVTCARGPSARPIAEFVIATIFNHARNLNDLWLKDAADWQDKRLSGRSIEGATLGLVGFGAIGQAIATLALGLGMRVLATRRSDTPSGVPGVEMVRTIAEVFAGSDHVALVAPATPETYRIVNREALSHAKPGLHLINVARGSLIDDDALIEALDTGHIGFATLDVTDPEPLPAGHPFYLHERIRLSPHVSMHTPAAMTGLVDKFADNIDRYRRGLPLLDIVSRARGY